MKGPRQYERAWVHIGTGSRHLLIRRNLTVPEIHRLLTAVLTSPAITTSKLLHWSS
ncbi:hypothetical protein ACFV6B_33560 [Streptomyces microflavus]|uniref:hypothetical protein n=1 Tax=Streptomyces microflavus TaxID=1919 RepID=UPI00364B1F4B